PPRKDLISRDFLPHSPAEIGIEKPLDLSIHNTMKTAHVVPGSGVFDALIGVQEVVADLRTEAYFGLGLVLLCLLAFAAFLLDAGQTRAKHLPGLGPVIVLAAFILALHHNARGDMGQADGAVGLVDVLSAGTTSAERVDANIVLVDI